MDEVEFVNSLLRNFETFFDTDNPQQLNGIFKVKVLP